MLKSSPYDVSKIPSDNRVFAILEVAHFFGVKNLEDHCLAMLAEKSLEVTIDADIQSLDYDLRLDLLDHILDLDHPVRHKFDSIISRLEVEPTHSQKRRHTATQTTTHMYRAEKGLFSDVFKVNFNGSLKCYSLDAGRGPLSNLHLWDLKNPQPLIKISGVVDVTLGPAGYLYFTNSSNQLQILRPDQTIPIFGIQLDWRACIFATSTLLVALPSMGPQARYDRISPHTQGKMWKRMKSPNNQSEYELKSIKCPFRADTRYIEFAPDDSFVVHASDSSLEISQYLDGELYGTITLVEMRSIRTWNGVEPGDLVHVAISPYSDSIVVIHGDGISAWKVKIKDLPYKNTYKSKLVVTRTDIERPVLGKSKDRLRCLVYSPNGRFFATVSHCGQIDIFHNQECLSKAACISCLFNICPKSRSYGSYTKSVAWSPYEDLLVVGLDCGFETVSMTKYLKSLR